MIKRGWEKINLVKYYIFNGSSKSWLRVDYVLYAVLNTVRVGERL